MKNYGKYFIFIDINYDLKINIIAINVIFIAVNIACFRNFADKIEFWLFTPRYVLPQM